MKLIVLCAVAFAIGGITKSLLPHHPAWVTLTVASLLNVVWWLAWELWIDDKES